MLTIYPSTPEVPVGDRGDSVFFQVYGKMIGDQVVPYSSARAVMLDGLRALGMGREDEIMVPPWMSHCVLSAITRSAFPVHHISSRTRAILVYHQFGFPQRMDQIAKVAREGGLYLVNDCATSLFSKCGERYVTNWGDLTALSLSKFYPCELGGGLIAHHPKVQQWVNDTHSRRAFAHATRSIAAYDTLRRIRGDLSDFDNQRELDSVYGQLPELIAFPSPALAALPQNQAALQVDCSRRAGIWKDMCTRFPLLVPDAADCDVVPFAIPLLAERIGNLEFVIKIAQERYDVELPVLHFDFNRNMLNPDYRKALVIGCHAGWSSEIVNAIGELIDIG